MKPTGSLTFPRRISLAVAVASIWGVSLSCASASTVFVENCADDGSSGSLRGAIATANSNMSIDTVDLTGLPTAQGCVASSITLTNGEIPISRSSLIIKGPASNATIDGRNKSRVFGHTGSGTLTLQNLNVMGGSAYYRTATTRGGCIYSHGNAYLKNSQVGPCYATSFSGDAEGGAIFTMGTTTLSRSHVLEGFAKSDSGTARGGGIFFLGGLRMKYSALTNSRADGASAFGGGAGTTTGAANVYLLDTTVSNNYSTDTAGALSITASSSFMLINSTITSNAAGSSVAGVFVISPATSLYNSTIAFNTSGGSAAFTASGIYVSGTGSGSTLKMNSMLISNNVADAGVASDLSTDNLTISGNHNLVYASSTPLPSDTLVGKCPLLGLPKFDGGPTLTLSLRSRSPAIDAGNNVRTPPLTFDQRGSPFSRVSGAFPDIGAFEVDQSDEIFNAGFEGCP